MQMSMRLLLIAGLLALAACSDVNGSAQGSGGSGGNSHGHVNMGVPF
jgi:hypothetical protein